ncbi:cell wall metabolism sensor histidine kinase WalK [Salmonella enterica subsp. diarizonae serovar 61:l,[v],[z13]:1,5,[7]]|nr:cell wall metabolism sensor histidine kinase WalK [Salmonella enterica subsp. diarizonae serovar 61:l,[v],[z13]:1,5,[7]]
MKRKSVALLQAIGSVIALSPTIILSANATTNPVSALRQDAKAINGDFRKAMVACNVDGLSDAKKTRQ